ncbi:hypothetical protein OG217_37235 (plasmid) [Streptomyces sp. NBC_01023]|uniref:hypothetical protein n=1 Tax=unclassified Streptomyces TaxID=2593676 RepID=UPI0030E06430|nr:hypothetical protein OG217_37235 [Streptomyces sp. NBC_01023]
MTLATLYARYSARLAAYVAGRLGEGLADTDDVIQDVWVYAAQLLASPDSAGAWTVLTALADRAVAAHQTVAHRGMEVPVGVLTPAARVSAASVVAPVLPAAVRWGAPAAVQVFENAA